MELIGNIKHYEWGKNGNESMIAKLAAKNDLPENLPNLSEPHAELWMGDHVSGPCTIKISSGTTEMAENLMTYIQKNRNVIGDMERLPFLFKVLSIKKALSIQVHPNKLEAEQLHAARPDLYKDDNHKPELAIALTPFLALCGFRPYDELYKILKEHQPLYELIGKDNVEKLKIQKSIALKRCFSVLMHSPEEKINSCISRLLEMLTDNNTSGTTTSATANVTAAAALTKQNQLIKSVFLTLNNDFPNDVGSLCVFFLHIIRLEPGQAIYLPAKEPHAYLNGECVECMACSDNVIRAGLTPKFKDVNTLIDMLNYEAEPIENKIFKPINERQYTKIFVPSVKDFAVIQIHVNAKEKQYTLRGSFYGSIVLVLHGHAETVINGRKLTLKSGSIVFFPANDCQDIMLTLLYPDGTDTTTTTTNAKHNEFQAYQAMYNEFL